MIYSLKDIQNDCFGKILHSEDSEIQLHFTRYGITDVQIKKGPFGTFILNDGEQQIAIGPKFAQKLKIEI